MGTGGWVPGYSSPGYSIGAASITCYAPRVPPYSLSLFPRYYISPLKFFGLEKLYMFETIRISYGRYNTHEDMEKIVENIHKAYYKIRAASD